MASDSSVLVATWLAEGRVKFCSGSLVKGEPGHAPLRVLTNHHCFANVSEDGESSADLLPDSCTRTKVYLGFTAKDSASAKMVGCRPGSLRTNFDGDLAVFTLSEELPATYRPFTIWDGDVAPVGRKAMIIHYPDVPEKMAIPRGERVKLPTAAVTKANCEVLGTFTKSEWSLERSLPFSLRHTCDLIHGSSGSALIDVETGKILGVNWGGIKIRYANEIRTTNVATQANYVQAFLNDDSVRLTQIAANPSSGLATAGEGSAERSDKRSASGLKDAVCGVLGSGSPGQPLLMLILMLAIPLFFSVRKGAPATTGSRQTK